MSVKKYAKLAIARLGANNYRTLNLIELDRRRFLHNFNFFKRNNPGAEVIPVLKGNAYGHGLSEVAQILNEIDCDFIAVDGYFEAAKIRDITKHQILVMGYILPANSHLLDTKKCSFVVQDIAGLRALGSLRKPVRVHMELNTGMNRMGLQPEEVDSYLAELQRHKNLQLEGVMSHLADADNVIDDSFTKKQVSLFDKLVAKIQTAGFEPKYIHIGQTAGSVKVKSSYANALRVGLGLYGINPLNSEDSHHVELVGLRPALELKSTILKILELQKGNKVSYNGIFTAPKKMKIGVLPLGYYEGVPREMSNKGIVSYRGQELPIVGRICMNHTMVDLKDSDAQVGSEVIIVSKDKTAANSIEQITKAHNLFSYSLLTGLSSNLRRQII